MTKLAEAIKEVLDKQDNFPEGSKFSYGKSALLILKAIDEAGYALEIHQNGISGSMLVVVKLPAQLYKT